MSSKFSKDVIPLSDLKINPDRVATQTKEELTFAKDIAQGLMDIKKDNTLTLSEAKKSLASSK